MGDSATPSLDEVLAGIGQQRPQWPARTRGKIAISIDRDGRWFYRGSPIERESMVRLFARLLRVDQGEHVIDAPEQILVIAVADAPFVAIDCEVLNPGAEQLLRFTTQQGESWTVGADHPLCWRASRDCPDEHRLYLRTRDGLDAVVHRQVFYRLAELAEVDQASGLMGIRSQGRFYSLT